MNAPSKEQKIDWKVVARRRLHPLQIGILDHLAEVGQDSPVKMRNKFKEPLGNVAYHAKALKEEGLLVIAEEIQRRGAIEHVYRLAEEVVV